MLFIKWQMVVKNRSTLENIITTEKTDKVNTDVNDNVNTYIKYNNKKIFVDNH